jgi:phospholipase C
MTARLARRFSADAQPRVTKKWHARRAEVVAQQVFAEDSDMPIDPIKHVVVLMLENHSFDQMLGFKRGCGEMSA